jgi:hypothetical protein
VTPKFKPSLRSTELQRIHAERQSAIIATILQELPDPIPKHCLQLLSHAPESFDDLRYGTIAAAAFNLHLDQRPISILTVQEELTKNPARPDLSEIFQFLSLRPMPLPAGIFEWECEELWHAYAYRQQATVLYEGAQSMIASPDKCDSIISHVRLALDNLSISQRNGDGLPEIVDGSSLLSTQPILPDLLIDGLLHKGSKLSLGGNSKAYKSWTFLNIALAISTGSDWLDLPTTRAKVLYLNFEIQPQFIHRRLHVLCSARNLAPDHGFLDIWNLRGYSSPHTTIIPKIITRTKALGYGLVIIDPSYKLFDAGADENSATDVGAMMNSFEHITTQTGASVAYGAHFAKGNASAKEAIDRVSGSGVFARDPDSIITFTKHEEPDCFTVEAILRNLPPIPAFVVHWDYPQFTRNKELDPSKLQRKPGRPNSHSSDDVFALISDHPLSASDWSKLAKSELGVPERSFYRIKDDLAKTNRVLRSRINGLWTACSK